MTVEWPVELEYVVEDAGVGMPDMIADESIGEAILEAITHVEARLFPARETLGGMLLIRTEPLPANVSFDVFWWDGQREWPFIELTARQGGTFGYGVGGRETLDGFDAEKVDVILRTNPEHIKDRRRAFDWLWDGEVVIRDVPVTWPE